MSGENLGPTAPWQIKDFPVELRRKITAAAADAKLTVGEYLTQFFVGDRALQTPARASSPAAPPSSAELRDLMQAALAASTASGAPMSKRAAHRFYGMVDDQVRAAAGLPARKTRQAPLRIAASGSAESPESDVPAS
jgi:hypothetical protein